MGLIYSLLEKIRNLRRIELSHGDFETAVRIIAKQREKSEPIVRTILLGRGPLKFGMKCWLDLNQYIATSIQYILREGYHFFFDLRKLERFKVLSNEEFLMDAYNLLSVPNSIKPDNIMKKILEKHSPLQRNDCYYNIYETDFPAEMEFLEHLSRWYLLNVVADFPEKDREEMLIDAYTNQELNHLWDQELFSYAIEAFGPEWKTKGDQQMNSQNGEQEMSS